jgi:hypothetical protein
MCNATPNGGFAQRLWTQRAEASFRRSVLFLGQWFPAHI